MGLIRGTSLYARQSVTWAPNNPTAPYALKVALKVSLEGLISKGFCGDTERVFYGAVAKVQGLRLHV